MANDSGGVWRTISGRHVFIRDGQSLSSAMKASGKFKNATKSKKTTNRMKEEVAKQKVNKLANENIELYKKHSGFNLDTGKEKGNRVSLKSEKSTSENDKIKQMYKDTWNGKMQYEELRNKLGQLEKEGKVSREELNKLKYDASLETDNWQNNPKNANNSEYIGNNTVATKEKSTSDYMNEKIRSRGKTKFEDDLPKKTEIKTQGTSNRKEVSENIQAHILEYYTKDYTGEDISPQEAFVRQMDAMGAPTKWKAGEEIARGGSYLIYNGDMADFLNDLKINPKGKTFSEDKAFDMYTSLVGRESAKLYTRIQRNAYNKYKKEHPLTQMSFEDFQKMNKK